MTSVSIGMRDALHSLSSEAEAAYHTHVCDGAENSGSDAAKMPIGCLVLRGCLRQEAVPYGACRIRVTTVST